MSGIPGQLDGKVAERGGREPLGLVPDLPGR